MPRLIFTLPLVAALSLSTALHAQDDSTTDTGADATTTTTETGAETATQTEGAAAADDTTATEGTAAETQDLDMGQEVEQESTFVKETYGDWQLKCFRNETEDDLCQMYQLLTEDAGNPVAEFSIFRLPGNSQAVAGATIVVPLGTLLTKELKIRVDNGKAKSFSYSFCTLVGCFARVGLTQADLDSFKRGNVATLQIVPAQAPDQTVDIKASLKGFTAAFDNVSTIEN